MERNRRQLNISKDVYLRLKEKCEKLDIPMTKFIEACVDHFDQLAVDWHMVRTETKAAKPSWNDINKRIEEVREKYPDLDDNGIVEMTGYTLATVEAVTHTAHKRALRLIRKSENIDPATLATKANVSRKFSERILAQYRGDKRIPVSERYLFQTATD